MLVLDSLLTELSVLLVTALACYYVYFLKVQSLYWAKKGIPFLPPRFVIGNALAMGTVKPIGQFFSELYSQHKDKRVLGFWSLHHPVVAVFDRDIIKNILIRDFQYFHDRIVMDIGDHDVLAKGNLFNLNGQAWRNMRVKLTPTFTTGKMKMMFPTMAECGDELSHFLDETAAAGKAFDVKDVSARFTTNVIASCAFGIETNALKNPDTVFRVQGKKIFNPTVKQIAMNVLFCVLMPPIGKIFKISQLPAGVNEFFINTVRDTMEYRQLNNVHRKDFMQLLIELKEKGRIDDADNKDEKGEHADTKFTLNEAAAQAFVFFAAGFETASLTMTLALYELANSKDCQAKLREEIKEAVEKENGSLSYESITKLEYLDCVIQETLRKYPPVPVLFRMTSKDYFLSELSATISKKILTCIPTVALTWDPEFFPNPALFDPTRFSPQREHEIPAYCHMPFGEGPRSCIGNRFGLLQTKVGLVSFLSQYSVDKCKETPEKLQFGAKSFTLTLSGGLPLKLVKD